VFCITIAENVLKAVKEKITLASKETGLFEIRVDALSPEQLTEEGLSSLLKEAPKLIFTFRSPLEGGLKDTPKSLREKWLTWALSQPFFLIDFEWQEFKELFKGAEPSLFEKVLFSYHNFSGTLNKAEFLKLLEEMAELGAKWVKLVPTPSTRAQAIELLELISLAKEKFGLNPVIFGMGEVAKFTRVLCLFFGSPYTYVVLKREETVAPGQLDIITAKRLYQSLKELF